MTTPVASRDARSYDGQRMPLAAYEALDLDAIKPYLEWWDGVVVQKPMPNEAHSRTQVRFARALLDYEEFAGGVAATEPHTWFERRGYRVPDVTYWAPSATRSHGKRLLPPTLAVEIASPGQKRELRDKCREMRTLGVSVCWLADPATHTVEVFDAEHDGTILSDRDTLTATTLPGFTLAIETLFPA